MKKRKLNIRGETLTETIIALSIMAIGITIASTVILNSMRNLTNAKNRVTAINIAREGIEAVRNIRDTNWLYYSDKRRQCWNHDPSAGDCDGLSPIPPDTYVVYKHTDQSWRLELADENIGIDSDLDGIFDNDLDLVDLSLVDIENINVDSDGNGDPADDEDFYNHKHLSLVNALGAELKLSRFTRYIVIEYLENKPDSGSLPSRVSEPSDSINTEVEWTDGTITQSELNRMRVTSVVGWEQKGAQHTAELMTIITDHLGREDLQS
jgi:type II secretory pathway pseudopilin PulG